MNVAETIQKITREHLEKNKGLALGQCLTAVGWVGGTVPEMREEDGLVELPMADVFSGGFAAGIALAQRRPIYIVRYQGFQWLNAPLLLNYASKSKDLWGIPCPIFVRSIAMDGGIGPVASGSHHSIYVRMPGVVVAAPMTPGEYQSVWDYFMVHDQVCYVSEHRRSFPIDYEMEDIIHPQADLTIFAISSTRLNAVEAVAELEKEGIRANLIHLLWLKPFAVSEKIHTALSCSRKVGLVVDGDFENGAAKCVAYDIMRETGSRVSVLGLEERTAGFAPQHDNLPPPPQKIIKRAKEILNRV